MRRAAAERTEPLAILRTSRRTVMVNFKLAEASAIDLAKKAAAAGVTQKQWIARALAESGIDIDPLDLENRSPKRRAAA